MRHCGDLVVGDGVRADCVVGAGGHREAVDLHVSRGGAENLHDVLRIAEGREDHVAVEELLNRHSIHHRRIARMR